MNLLVVGNSEGEKRCDARCYNAKKPNCECCCGGKNHGAGLKRASANIREMAQEMFFALDTRPYEEKAAAWAKIAQAELLFEEAV